MKKVVVIGGGFAGSYVAKKLQRNFEVTLIDDKEYFEFTPSVLKVLINPRLSKKIHLMHKDYLKKTNLIVGNVTGIQNNFVLVKGKKVKFDYLVICSGSKYNLPIKSENVVLASRTSEILNYNKKLESSRKILIMGGGFVGVELAGEIAVNYSDKKIVLVHPRDRVIQRAPVKASRYVEKFLFNRNVDIFYGEKIKSYKRGIFSCESGMKIKADFAFACTGIVPNSDFIRKKSPKMCDDKGFLKVNKNLQLIGRDNVFVAGDVNNWDIEKTAQNALHQAKVVVKNILAAENGGKLKKYDGKETPLVLSLGRYGGLFLWNRFVLTGFLPAIMKYLIEKKEILRIRDPLWNS